MWYGASFEVMYALISSYMVYIHESEEIFQRGDLGRRKIHHYIDFL